MADAVYDAVLIGGGVKSLVTAMYLAKYGGMDVSEARRLKGLEEENRQLKRLVADQALDIQALRYVLEKK